MGNAAESSFKSDFASITNVVGVMLIESTLILYAEQIERLFNIRQILNKFILNESNSNVYR